MQRQILNTKLPIVVFGNNEYTDILIKRFNVVGIIDDYDNSPHIKGISKVTLDLISKEQVIVSVVNNSRASTLFQNLQQLGFDRALFIGEVINQYPDLFANTMLRDAQIGMTKIISSLGDLRSSLTDLQSKKDFDHMVAFRNELDIQKLKEFEVLIDQQYYEPFVLREHFCTLIDGGAYDGIDSLKFSQFFPDYKQLFVVEPCAKNLPLISKTLKNTSYVEILHTCLGDQEKEVGFSGDGTSAQINALSKESVTMKTIDSINYVGRTLVKLDIEGAEVSCLKGASNAINDPKVSFAVSAYHLATDFLDIYNLLSQSEVKRKFYFRHYSSGLFESIIFAI